MGTYNGTSAADTITPDEMTAGVGRAPTGSFPSISADVIDGRAGDDVLDGGGGADTIRGGDGDDQVCMKLFYDLAAGETIRFTGTASLYGDAGNDTMSNTYVGQYFNFDSATFRFYGGTGNDHLAATYYYPLSEHTNYGAATDVLHGGAGNDSYTLWESSDVVVENANEGYDAVEMNGDNYSLPANVERLEFFCVEWEGAGFRGNGNSLDNTVIGSNAGDTINGLGGNDTIFGKALVSFNGIDSDTIRGGDGNDILYGGGGRGETGDDSDTLYGDLGNDTIYGQDGDDTVYGGRGLDDPTDGPDRIYGDAGNDQVWAGGGDDIVYGGAGNEIHLSGQSGNDTLYGDVGTDYLAGGSGNDTLYGGTENDRLSGTDGLDRLFGQAGTDTFDYDAVSHSGIGSTLRDVVGDFTGVGGTTRTEAIDLSTIDANTSVTGNQAFTFRGTSAFSAPGQIRVQASGTSDTLIQANVTGTSGAEMEILVTDGTALPTAWNALDFLL